MIALCRRQGMNMPRRVQVRMLMSIFLLGLAAGEQQMAQDMDCSTHMKCVVAEAAESDWP